MQIFQQQSNEERFGRHHIEKKVIEELSSNSWFIDKTKEVKDLLNQWLETEHWESKELRKSQLKLLDLDKLIESIFIFLACSLPTETSKDTYVSITSQLANKLGFSDKKDSIRTIAEVLVLFAIARVINIVRVSNTGSLYIYSYIPLSNRTQEFIEYSQYLPPMVTKPLELVHNKSSGYLTIPSETLILGNGNHHDGDICLDVLNLMNSVELCLDRQFLSSCEEEPTFEFETIEQKEEWDKFKKQSYYFYYLLTTQSDSLYLTHKVDKRGRIYANGYHISTQGTAFKKASLELANKELVTGEL